LPKILLVDDSITIQKVVERTFAETDFEVTSLGNGDEALARLDGFLPDFVIADVHMPGASGYEIATRASQMGDGIPVLLLVGTFEPFDEEQAKASGASGFLMKPFDSQELLSRIDALSRESGDRSSSASVVGVRVEDPMPGSDVRDPEPAEDSGESEPAMASVAPPAAVPDSLPSAPVDAVPAEEADPGLSDDDIERIARRLVELISPEIVRQISHEVIPDLAEKVVRERIRQLEAEDE
jgi:CheY-like chemotaxis protein